jgi:hypothetical protein
LLEAVIAATGSGSTVTVTLAVGAGTVVVVVPDVVEDATPAVAVTFAVLLVVSFVLALPLASVLTTAGLTEPLSVLNVTGTSAMRFPPGSLAVAVIVD